MSPLEGFRRGADRHESWDGKRIYTLTRPDGTKEQFWSVTTCLQALSKPALPRWAAKEVATFAVTNRESWLKLEQQAAIDLLKGSPWRARDHAAGRGLAIHRYVEALVNGEELEDVPADQVPYVEGFLAFHRDFKPTYRAAELTVYCRRHSYAGTIDLIAEFDGIELPLLIDAKTGRGLYGETQLQLCAYRHAEFFLEGDQEVEMPSTEETALVLHLKGDGTYALHPVVVDEEIFRVFVALRRTWGWVVNTSEGAIGAPLMPH